ncbi:MAG: ATP-binding protein [Candidatus Paceibacterota bacterium]|jgi:signal transduction histidine kinase
MFSNYYCPGNLSVLGAFDFSYAPTLIFYAYIPIILVSIFFGLLLIFRDKFSIQGKLIFLLSLFFSFWNLNVIAEWITVPVNLNHFFWQLTMLFEMPIPLLAIYLTLVFIYKKDISSKLKILLTIFFLPVPLLLATVYNIGVFDVQNCQPAVGWLTYYVYAIEIFSILWIVIAAYRKYQIESSPSEKKQILLMVSGISLFLLTFSLSNILGEWTQFYQINLIGPIGMVVFLALMTYLIVKFKTFNIKLIGTQALVWALIILIGSEFFFIQTNVNRILTAVTLVISAWMGLIIVRSVKKEIEAREIIEGMAKKLEGVNTELEGANAKLKVLDQQKSEFVSIASHQLRSPLTVIKGYLSMMIEGEPELADLKAGTITPKGVEVMNTMFQSTNRLAHIIEDFLNVSRIEQGKMKYEMSDFDIRQMAREVVGEFQAEVGERKLTLICTDKSPNASYMVYADAGKLRQVIGNIIDNSIKYTPQGGITVYLERLADSTRLSVKDTGIGISAENLKNLFQKFSRASNGGKVNVTGSGLGLFVAVEIMKAHKGKLWAESDGEGKGSTFVIELPIKKRN